MMKVIEWDKAEEAKIGAIHAKMGLEYGFPCDFGPLFFIKRAVVDENGKIVAAAAVKLVGEAFLWVDHDFASVKRARATKILQDECSKAARLAGLEEISAWIPPRIRKWFAPALRKLGWRKSPWRNYTVVLK